MTDIVVLSMAAISIPSDAASIRASPATTYVEIELPSTFRTNGPAVANRHRMAAPVRFLNQHRDGSGKPTEQHNHLASKFADGHGGWRTARANLGFPAGRKKTCLIDLTGLFSAGTPRKLRSAPISKSIGIPSNGRRPCLMR